MPKFNYILTDATGQKFNGKISSTNKELASRKLHEENPEKILIFLEHDKKSLSWIFNKPHLSFEEKLLFTKHLATMIKVGITITESIQILQKQAKNKAVKMMYDDILEMISTGQTLANSLRKYDYIFSELFINMIETGEQSGNLEKTLEYLDIQLEKEYELRKKIIGAFTYPAVIIGLTTIMAIGIVVFIMPKITAIFDKFDIDLPLATRMLIAFSKFLTEQTFLAIFILVGGITFLTIIFKLKSLKPFWHHVILNLPVFGGILVAGNIARFARTLNSLLQSGVPITNALRTTANMLDNSIYKKAITQAAAKVEQGGHLGESFESNEKLFPDLATKLLYIGEKTGSLELTTQRLAELYENTVDSKTKNLSVLIEPLLLVFMGALVGGIALAIIFPIYQLPNLISK